MIRIPRLSVHRAVALTVLAGLMALGITLGGVAPASAALQRCTPPIYAGDGLTLTVCIYVDNYNAKATTSLFYNGTFLGNGASITAQVNRSGTSLQNTCPLPGVFSGNSVIRCNAYIPNPSGSQAFSATGWTSWGVRGQTEIVVS
jgi:hypothetical protein